MKNNNEEVKSYYRLTRNCGDFALEGSNYVDRISFGYYDVDEVPIAEMTMQWHNIETFEKPVAKLEVYVESFPLLGEFRELINELAESNSDNYIQPSEFCEILTRCGFKELRINS